MEKVAVHARHEKTRVTRDIVGEGRTLRDAEAAARAHMVGGESVLKVRTNVQ